MTLGAACRWYRRFAAAGLIVWALLAALSVAAGMALAGLYAAGEFAGRDWITIPRMTLTHGLFNGIGFSLCGLAGWAVSTRRSSAAAAARSASP